MEAVVVVEVAPMPVLIVTIGHSMVIADQIMHIWVNHVEKHVVSADIKKRMVSPLNICNESLETILICNRE